MHTLHSVPGWGPRGSVSHQLPGDAMLLVQGPPLGIEDVTCTEHYEGEGGGHIASPAPPHTLREAGCVHSWLKVCGQGPGQGGRER